MMDGSARRKAGIWVGIVFLLGAVLGVAAGYAVAHHEATENQSLTHEARRAQKVERLTRELNLTPEQQKQLDAVLADVHEKYKAIHQSTAPQINAVRQAAREQIRSFLTPEQKPKFEDFLRRLDEERKKNAE